jgi:hypothetical protein
VVSPEPVVAAAETIGVEAADDWEVLSDRSGWHAAARGISTENKYQGMERVRNMVILLRCGAQAP